VRIIVLVLVVVIVAVTVAVPCLRGHLQQWPSCSSFCAHLPLQRNRLLVNRTDIALRLWRIDAFCLAHHAFHQQGLRVRRKRPSVGRQCCRCRQPLVVLLLVYLLYLLIHLFVLVVVEVVVVV